MSRQFDEYYFDTNQYLLDSAEWCMIPGYPDYYICKEGYVEKDMKILKLHKGDKQGHINVRLRKDGKQKEEYVHRLVAMTFLPNPKKYPIVRHLDDDKSNNHVDNLSWGTMRDNHLDSVRNGTYRPFTERDKEKMIEVCRTPVIATNIKSGEELYFNSQADASRELNVQQSNIHKVLNGKREQTVGYKFRYAEKGE